MAKTYDQATQRERIYYYSTYESVIRSLKLAIGRLDYKLTANQYNTHSAKLRDEQHLSMLESQKAMVKSAKIAFEVSQATIRPPKLAVAAKAEALSNQVYELTHDTQRVEDIVALATEAFKLFNKVQSVG